MFFETMHHKIWTHNAGLTGTIIDYLGNLDGIYLPWRFMIGTLGVVAER